MVAFEDLVRICIEVKFDTNPKKTYLYRCREWHFRGDIVCVKTRDGYENVTVDSCTVKSEKELQTIARAIGYPDITEVFCDSGIELG